MIDFSKLVSEFNSNGYCVIQEALSKEEVSSLTLAGDKLMNESASEFSSISAESEYAQERNCMARDERFHLLLRHPNTFPLALKLLSQNIQLHTSQLIYKFPTKDKSKTTLGPGWHRDIYPSSDDLGPNNQRFEVKIAYCLSDFLSKNAGVTLLAKGSHLLTTPLKVQKDKNRPLDYAELELKAGDAYVFENRTFHAGAPNFTERTGKVIIIGYSYCWLKPDDYTQFSGPTLNKMDDIDKVLVGALKSPQNRWVPSGYRQPLIDWAINNQLYKSNYTNVELV